MPGGLRNQPKVFRGAFVEYGLTIPPLVVVFQSNPLQLSQYATAHEILGEAMRGFHGNAVVSQNSLAPPTHQRRGGDSGVRCRNSICGPVQATGLLPRSGGRDFRSARREAYFWPGG